MTNAGHRVRRVMQTGKSQTAYRLSMLVSFLTMSHAVNSFGQIVNIEAQRIITDTSGWFGDLSGNFSLQENVNRIYSLNGQVHVENKSRSTKDLWLFLGNAGVLKVDSSDFANNTFALALYNRKLNNVIRAELLTARFKNRITKIDPRWMTGGGLRFKLADLKTLKIYAAALYLFEHERSALSEMPSRKDNRLSPYVTFTFTPLLNLKLVTTTYYQPRTDDFSDYRILHVDQIKIDVSTKFSFTIDFNYLYDEFPQPDVPKKNLTLSMGIQYRLK